MHLVTRKHLREASKHFRDAAKEIESWAAVVESARWHNFAELRGLFRDADFVDGYVIFNIRRNRYRLVTVVHYAKAGDGIATQGHVYIRSFLTHQQYADRRNWDRRFGRQ